MIRKTQGTFFDSGDDAGGAFGDPKSGRLTSVQPAEFRRDQDRILANPATQAHEKTGRTRVVDVLHRAGDVVMGQLHPGVVVILHHVAVSTSFACRRQIRSAFGVIERRHPSPHCGPQQHRSNHGNRPHQKKAILPRGPVWVGRFAAGIAVGLFVLDVALQRSTLGDATTPTIIAISNP